MTGKAERTEDPEFEKIHNLFKTLVDKTNVNKKVTLGIDCVCVGGGGGARSRAPSLSLSAGPYKPAVGVKVTPSPLRAPLVLTGAVRP